MTIACAVLHCTIKRKKLLNKFVHQSQIKQLSTLSNSSILVFTQILSHYTVYKMSSQIEQYKAINLFERMCADWMIMRHIRTCRFTSQSVPNSKYNAENEKNLRSLGPTI